jgi:hypothetical protein
MLVVSVDNILVPFILLNFLDLTFTIYFHLYHETVHLPFPNTYYYKIYPFTCTNILDLYILPITFTLYL